VMKTNAASLALCKFRALCCAVAAAAVIAAGCGARRAPPRAPYVSIKELEALYGSLITVGNEPTPHQHGTGDRLGLFQERNGTVWGLPLITRDDGTVLGCAPPSLREAPVTGMLPSEASEIVGATNAPTGWRGGTGQLELVFRDKSGEVRWQAVASGALNSGPQCWAQEPPGPAQRLEYYRLAPRHAQAP